MAKDLAISEKTVKNHLSAIFPKIGAADRTQAALYAARTWAPARHSGVPPVSRQKALTARSLTLRQLGVLRLVAQGLTNRRIARDLAISEKTVKNHLSAIFPKIGAADRTQAALYALRAGLTQPAPTSPSGPGCSAVSPG
ncbi:response regulator transcription factor [Streptacidiphilus sp. P02-A3a]|nr:response regulator transcription factor [Streptacidiphilus sp. P02-A3a]